MKTDRPSEDAINRAHELIADQLQGAPSHIFGALSLLYRAAIVTDDANFVAGRLLHKGDEVSWKHGNGIRRGHIVSFYETEVGIRFPSGAFCAIEHHRILTNTTEARQ